MKIIAFIQARMSSSRLPGKVLKPLARKPVLQHIYERLLECKLLDKVVIATSVDISDDPISNFCMEKKFSCFRGSLEDVLDRIYQASLQNCADAIVRITGDCPVIDPIIVDATIAGFLGGNYHCYGLGGEFPDGLDCSVFSKDALEKAWLEAKLPSEREHVEPYMLKNPDLFNIGKLHLFSGLLNERWTLDEKEDFDFLSLIFDNLHSETKLFYTHQILEFLKNNPKIALKNSKIKRNQGYLNSLLQEGNI